MAFVRVLFVLFRVISWIALNLGKAGSTKSHEITRKHLRAGARATSKIRRTTWRAAGSRRTTWSTRGHWSRPTWTRTPARPIWWSIRPAISAPAWTHRVPHALQLQLLIRRQLVLDANRHAHMQHLDLALGVEHFAELGHRLLFVHLVTLHGFVQRFHGVL